MVDILGYRAKLGFLIASTNTVVAADAARICPPGASVHFSDGLSASGGSFERVAEDELSRAGARMASREPTITGLLVDDALFADGAAPDGAPAPCVTPSQALRAALDATGWRTGIGLLTPFGEPETERVARRLEEIGFAVAARRALGFAAPLAPAHISFVALRAAHQDLLAAGAACVVQVGHNLPYGKLAGNLEEDFGKPVLAINTVCAWHMLRQAGIADLIPGAGQLFMDY